MATTTTTAMMNGKVKAKEREDLTPRTPEEQELVHNLLRGLRAFERNGLYVNYEWCKVRRSTRSGAVTMTVEFDAARFNNDD